MNDYGQLAIGKELGERVPFFPEFRRVENFGRACPVESVALAAFSSHVLAGGGRLFACGHNEFG